MGKCSRTNYSGNWWNGTPIEPTEEELANQKRLGYVVIITGTAGLASGVLSGLKDIATTGEVKIWTAIKIVGAVKAGGVGLSLISASNNGVLIDINLGPLTP